MTTKKKDHTTAVIFSFVTIVIVASVFGVAIEILKFAALVKWVFA